MHSLTCGVAGSAGAVTAADARTEPSHAAVGACTVLGIVAHAVAVFIHKRTAALGSPVTGSLRGPCGTAAQRIARAFQPCDACAGSRAIYLDLICGACLRIQATGRGSRCGAGAGTHSVAGGDSAGRGHRNRGSKGHCSYQGNCSHIPTVILMRSFHLAPLSTCLAGVSYCAGAFVPFTINTNQGRVSLHVISKVFFRL